MSNVQVEFIGKDEVVARKVGAMMSFPPQASRTITQMQIKQLIEESPQWYDTPPETRPPWATTLEAETRNNLHALMCAPEFQGRYGAGTELDFEKSARKFISSLLMKYRIRGWSQTQIDRISMEHQTFYVKITIWLKGING